MRKKVDHRAQIAKKFLKLKAVSFLRALALIKIFAKMLSIIFLLLFLMACSRETANSPLYKHKISIPGSGGIIIQNPFKFKTKAMIPLSESTTLYFLLDDTGEVLLRYIPVPYIDKVTGELQEVELISKDYYFKFDGNSITYGNVDDGKIKMKKPLWSKIDKKNQIYLFFENQSDTKKLRVYLFQFLGFPGLSSTIIPKKIELPFLKKNKFGTKIVDIRDASIFEILYYIQKSSFFNTLDKFYRSFHLRKEADKRFVIYNDDSGVLKKVTIKEFARIFLRAYNNQYHKTASLSDLGDVLDEVISSVTTEQSELTDLQRQAFEVSSYIYWLCYAYQDFSLTIPRLETKEEGPVIYGNPEILLNLLYHYWISKNPNVMNLQFNDKMFSILYPFLRRK